SLGVSATALSALPDATAEDVAMARSLFGAVGNVYDVREEQFDAFTGMAGSGPAYVALVAEALADGGVRVGLDRPLARDLARQVLLAAARLLETRPPSGLKDAVSSAGGTAIAGVPTLERHRLRVALTVASPGRHAFTCGTSWWRSPCGWRQSRRPRTTTLRTPA